MNRLVVIFIVGCGVTPPSKSSTSTCETDNQCGVGQVCAASGCVTVDANDPSTWPKPRNSAELLERLGTSELAIKSSTDGNVSLVISDPLHTQSVVWSLSAGDAHTKVIGNTVSVWGLSLHGEGGPVGPSPIYVQNLQMTSTNQVDLPIVIDTYPRAHATGVTTLTLSADIGTDPANLSRVTASVDNVPLNVDFNLDQGLLSADINLGDGRSLVDFGSAFKLGALTSDSHLLGLAVPTTWQ